MPNLYLTGHYDTTGFVLNDDSIHPNFDHVPSVTEIVITIPSREVEPLYRNLTAYLKHDHLKSSQPHLGYRNVKNSFELMSYIQDNPTFTDYHLKNVDKLSKRTNTQPQVDAFIVSNLNQIEKLQAQLDKYLTTQS